MAGHLRSETVPHALSRERVAVLLDVVIEEFVLFLWRTELRKALSRDSKRRGTIEHISRAFSATVAARPLLCPRCSISA